MSRFVESASSNLRSLTVVLLLGAFVVLGIGIGLTLSSTGVLASHDDPNTIHACVYTSSGYTQILPPGVEPNCRSNQFEVSWQNTSGFDDLEARVEALEIENAEQATQISDLETENAAQATQISDLVTTVADHETRISALESTTTTVQTDLDALAMQVPDCLSEVDDNAVFSGCNVQVNNGVGNTESKNGSGNLIVGYNEDSFDDNDHTGSHNIVVGQEHSFSSWGGFVVGEFNTISGEFASVSGGSNNSASGLWTSVSGGRDNTASSLASSVSGGQANTASSSSSSVSGGAFNTASGLWTSVSGGQWNTANIQSASVSGGLNNTAIGSWSSISGGDGCTLSDAVHWGTRRGDGTGEGDCSDAP